MEFLTSSSAVEQVFNERVPVLFRLRPQVHARGWRDTYFMPTVSHYSTDQQVTVTSQETQETASKGSGEEKCKPVNMDVNNARFKMF